MQELEQAALSAIDRANALSPIDVHHEGKRFGKEELYGIRMSQVLQRFAPDSPLALRIAVRAQHLERWTLQRSEYPEGRGGYLRWRQDAQKIHATRVGELLSEVGADEPLIEKVQATVRKRGQLAQTLEDVACLVFLEFEFDAFAAKHPREKVISILQKTWGKMSPRAQAAALELNLGEGRALVEEALAVS